MNSVDNIMVFIVGFMISGALVIVAGGIWGLVKVVREKL